LYLLLYFKFCLGGSIPPFRPYTLRYKLLYVRLTTVSFNTQVK